MLRRCFSLLLCLFLAGFSSHLVAENSTSIPGYTIHHNAFTTDTLTPAIAAAYGLQRSKNRGMININVVKEVPGAIGKSVEAAVEIQAVNLTGQPKNVSLRKIREDDAIYYIGEFPVSQGEIVNFVLEVTPSGVGRPYTAKLSQQFFTD